MFKFSRFLYLHQTKRILITRHLSPKKNLLQINWRNIYTSLTSLFYISFTIIANLELSAKIQYNSITLILNSISFFAASINAGENSKYLRNQNGKWGNLTRLPLYETWSKKADLVSREAHKLSTVPGKIYESPCKKPKEKWKKRLLLSGRPGVCYEKSTN